MDGVTWKLTPEERIHAVEHINQKTTAPNDACLVCGSPDSSVGSFVLRIPTGDVRATQALIQPVVPVVCNNCGFTRLFTPQVMGIGNFLSPTPGED